MDVLRNSETTSEFNSHLFSLIRPSKRDINGIHNITGIKHIFRLRLGLSHLKSHKNRHNFLDTPDLCDCRAAPEDSFHFVFKCKLLNDVQIKLRRYDLINLLDNLDVY